MSDTSHPRDLEPPAATVLAAQSGDARALESLVLAAPDRVYRLSLRMTARPADAEDATQEILMRAFNGLGTFDGAFPRAWLLTIMRNANINRRRRQRPGLLHDATDLAGEADRRNPPAPSAEDVAATRTRAPWIAEALARLSPRHVQVVQLVDVDGLTYDEAAAALGVPAGTVMSRLHRARHRMRAHLVHHPDFRSEHR